MSEQQNADDNESQKIRENLVNTAVNFLLNPGVIDKPYEHKTAFLKKKGLTDAEISLAYKRAECDPKYGSFQRNEPVTSVLPPPVPLYSRPVSFWSRLSNFSSSLILLGVAVYGAHYFYKKYIEPLIYGEEFKNAKSLNLENQLSHMTNSLSQLQKTVSSLEENIKNQKEQMDKYLQNEVSEYYPTPLALKDLKSEIGSIKSMLLNRHQFPALPKITPTIPQWQLPSTSTNEAPVENGENIEQQYSTSPKVASPEQTSISENSNETAITANGDMEEASEAKLQSDKNMNVILDSNLSAS